MLYSVNFLRFIAAMGVLLHHIYAVGRTPITIGAAGVDVFFVISGIVLGLAVRTSTSAGDFLLRRFIRVMPIYWLATAAFVGFGLWAWQIIPTWRQIFYSIALIPALDQHTVLIYWPAWTLAYELLFYTALACSLRTRRPIAVTGIFMAATACLEIHAPWGEPESTMGTPLCLEFVYGLLISAAWQRFVRPDRAIGALCLFASALFSFSMPDTLGRVRLVGDCRRRCSLQVY